MMMRTLFVPVFALLAATACSDDPVSPVPPFDPDTQFALQNRTGVTVHFAVFEAEHISRTQWTPVTDANDPNQIDQGSFALISYADVEAFDPLPRTTRPATSSNTFVVFWWTVQDADPEPVVSRNGTLIVAPGDLTKANFVVQLDSFDDPG